MPRRRVQLSGTIAAFENAFGTTLANYETPGGTFRGRLGPLHIPVYLAAVVQAVLGLDNRPQAQPHFTPGSQIATPEARTNSYTPLQMATLYDFPADTDGSGQCIALIELGGGYQQQDLDTYFTGLGQQTRRLSRFLSMGQQSAPRRSEQRGWQGPAGYRDPEPSPPKRR